jgi:hypothetical protein
MCGELNRDKTEKSIERSVTVILDKKRHLVLDDQALKVFEFDGGELKNFATGKATLWDLVHLLRACLAHEDDNLTIDQVMRMVNQGNMEKTFVELLKCLRGVVDQVNKIVKSEVKHGRRF